MSINIVVNQRSSGSSIKSVSVEQLNDDQKLAYAFSKKMLKTGTDLLKIEARSRLAVNGLCFCDLYHSLNR